MKNDEPTRNFDQQDVVLVVDDDAANLSVVFDALRQANMKVLIAKDGRSALDRARRATPDIILLDVMMPGIDGFETCRQLKSDESTKDIPVIFMSALTDIVDEMQGFRVGAVDYITKPIQFETMLARLKTHITLRRLQQNLHNQNQQLQEENRKREALEAVLRSRTEELDAFSRTVAHDLKSPLSIIVGYTDLLLTMHPDIDPADLKLMLEKIKQTGKKMNNIIQDLLLLAGVRKGEAVAFPLDMAHVVKQAKQRLELMLQEYQGEIIVPAQWPTAMGYGSWIEEVWVNYISNGLKYGGRPPSLRLGATPQDNGQIRFWVKDNGPGLTPEEQERLFNEFIRLHKINVDGHGLGLSIVRRIIERLGGQVGIESSGNINQGSTFYFTLPAAGS